ncbi:MAG: hypothetical protein H7322_09980, partial [Ramlibacter sp.]|nr:hypothetical protein [Ramlibacter sp.]
MVNQIKDSFSVPTLDSCNVASTLERLAAEGANTTRIAHVVVTTWQAIDAALAPVIGGKGVAALYGRSLHLVGTAHPWLAAAHQGPHAPMDLGLLGVALAQQESTIAAAGAGAHLQSLHQLLGSLIGTALAGQLLRPAWDTAFDGIAVQDIS